MHSFFSVVLSLTCPQAAPPTYTYINGKYYYMETAAGEKYYAAMNICKRDGARMAGIKTPDEFNLVWMNMVASTRVYYFIPPNYFRPN